MFLFYKYSCSRNSTILGLCIPLRGLRRPKNIWLWFKHVLNHWTEPTGFWFLHIRFQSYSLCVFYHIFNPERLATLFASLWYIWQRLQNKIYVHSFFLFPFAFSAARFFCFVVAAAIRQHKKFFALVTSATVVVIFVINVLFLSTIKVISVSILVSPSLQTEFLLHIHTDVCSIYVSVRTPPFCVKFSFVALVVRIYDELITIRRIRTILLLGNYCLRMRMMMIYEGNLIGKFIRWLT